MMKFFEYPKVHGLKNMRKIDIKYIKHVFDIINEEAFNNKMPIIRLEFANLPCAAETFMMPSENLMRFDNAYRYYHQTDSILPRIIMHEMVHVRILSKLPKWLGRFFYWMEGPYLHGVVFHIFMWYYSVKMWGLYRGTDYLFGDFFMVHHSEQ